MNCDVMVVTETWLTEKENPLFNLKNYNSFFCNREGGYGGVAIYVKTNLPAVQIYKLEEKFCQILCVKIINTSFNIIGVYRSQKQVLSELFKCLEHLLINYQKSFVVGDFNVDLLKDNINTYNYLSIINSNGFAVLNKINYEFATRINNESISILDHILTDLFGNTYNIYLADTHISDHRMLFAQLNATVKKSSTTYEIKVLHYNKIINHKKWSNVLNSNNIENLSYNLREIVQSCTGKKIYQKKAKQEWMTPEILSLINKREKIFSLKKKYPTSSYFSQRHKELSKMVASKIKYVKKKYYGTKIEKYIYNPKHLWVQLKQLIFNKVDSKQNEIYLCDYLGDIMSQNKVANEFNSYFMNVARDITKHLPKSSKIDFNYIHYDIKIPLEFDPVHELEIKMIIKSLNTSAATGIDKISTKVLKYLMDYITPVLIKLINNCLETGKFPDTLKEAKLVPLYKSGNQMDINNYRPIAILNSLSKIYEKVILNRLLSFFTRNQIIHGNQYGFLKKSSTTAACLKLTDVLSREIDNSQLCACVFLDIKKAFDSVDHEILFYKLDKLCFNPIQKKLISSYMTNRQHMVSVNGTNSSLQQMKKGVPQGSILGPLIFIFFINDIFQLKLNGELQLYADDGILIYSAKNIENLMWKMQNDLFILKSWFDKNHLILNTEKTKFMLFGNALAKYNNEVLQYDLKYIKKVNIYNYLGLNLDQNMNWLEHIEIVKKTITPYIFVLKRIRHIISKNQLLLIYHAYIQSRLVYLNPIWSGAASYKVHELEILQKRALKYILNVSIYYPTSKLFKEFHSFSFIIKKELILLIYKITHNLIKHGFQLATIAEGHQYDTRRVSQYQIDFFHKVTTSRNNVLYRGIRLYNELPTEMRQLPNIKLFKTKLLPYLENHDS